MRGLAEHDKKYLSLSLFRFLAIVQMADLIERNF